MDVMSIIKKLPLSAKQKAMIPKALEMSGAIQSKEQLSQFLKNNGVDNKFIDKHLGKINNPVVKGAAKMVGVNIDAIVDDVRSCINPETKQPYASYDRRNPANAAVFGKTGGASKYDNIRYKK